MVSLRDVFLGQPLKKEGGLEKGKEAEPAENKPEQNSDNKMGFSGSIDFREFENIVAGGRDAYGKYKGFHGDYKDQMQQKFTDIINGLKKEGKHIDKAYIHNLSVKLHNEPDQASKLLAKAMGYK